MESSTQITIEILSGMGVGVISGYLEEKHGVIDGVAIGGSPTNESRVEVISRIIIKSTIIAASGVMLASSFGAPAKGIGFGVGYPVGALIGAAHKSISNPKINN